MNLFKAIPMYLLHFLWKGIVKDLKLTHVDKQSINYARK